MNNIKRSILLFVCILFLVSTIKAAGVSKEKALKVAKNFISRELKLNPEKLTSNYQAIKNDAENTLHIFSNEKSYIIIAANDRVFPIIAYSTESSFPAKGEVESLDWWVNNCSKSIASESRLKSTINSKVKKAWDFYLSDNKSTSLDINTSGVLPFLPTYWNQDGGYNYYCPSHVAGPNGKCYAGCVATAMAQIMRYYKYPAVGRGSHSYNHPYYANISVNFEQSVYEWQHMGISLSATESDTVKRNAIAKLIYDCGVSVDMYYTPSGSSSFLYKAQTSLYDYFKYKRYILYDERTNFTDEVWRNMMMENLNMKYPILYGGQDPSEGGHAWVCDGYQNTNYFHFNWGWSGSGNGFFYLNNLNSGNGNFTSGQDMVYNIIADSSIYPKCDNSKKFTSQTYTFNDGSFSDNYDNNTNCQWLIKPDSGVSIKLDFLNFNTEQGNDVLSVYDGETTSAPILGSFSGQTKPATIYSTTGAMLLVFVTNATITDLGWNVKYTVDNVGIAENEILNQLKIFPNPAHNQLNISGNYKEKGNVKFSIFNTMGMEVLSYDKFLYKGLHSEIIDINSLKQGIYILNIESCKGKYYTKFIVE